MRRYSPSQGRWISPDPAGLAAVNLKRPQTWNRYVYSENNPLAYIDEDGTTDNDCSTDDDSCDDGGGDDGGGDDGNGDDGNGDDNSGNNNDAPCNGSDPNCQNTDILDLPVQQDCTLGGSNLDPNNNPMISPNGPLDMPPLSGSSFSTPVEAGAAAVAETNAASQSSGLEMAGTIYQNIDGSYSFTAANSGTATSVNSSAYMPLGAFAVGAYHTHPDTPGYATESFSVQDALTANKLATYGPYTNNTAGYGGPGVNVVGTPSGNTLAYVGSLDPSAPQGVTGTVSLVAGPGCGS